MGVSSRNKKRGSGNSNAARTIMLLVMVGVPFFLIRTCTAKSGTSAGGSRAAVKAEAEANDTVQSANQEHHVAEAGLSIDELFTQSATATAEEAYIEDLYTQTYHVDSRDGLYVLNGPVMDTAHIFSKEKFGQLSRFLERLNKQTSVQIAVLTVDSLNGKDIAEFSIEHAAKWQLGQKNIENGALLTVAMAEHDIRIDTGYGSEGILTDVKCGRIIRNILIPKFQSGKYEEGICDAVCAMASVITGDESLVISDADEGSDTGLALFIIFIFFGFFIFIVIYGLTHSSGTSGAPVAGGTVGSMGRTSFSSGSGSSHSSGSSFRGGGGGFGGGGASGHW